MTFDELLDRLDGVRRSGDGRAMARCPAHQDKRASLSIRELDDGTLLLHCFSGCDALSICRSIGVEFADLFPARRIRRVEHNERPRIPAGERLELLEHEIGVAVVIANDFLRDRQISEENVLRLAQACGRIGSARHA